MDEVNILTYGVRVGFQTDDPQLFPGLQECLPPGAMPYSQPGVDLLYRLERVPAAAEESSGVRVRANRRTVHVAPDSAAALGFLEGHLALTVAARSQEGSFVHAGVVGWRGGAIVIPGRSRTGKTSLVAALVRRGAEYYSDEYAVFDADGRVHPYTRPLSIRRKAGDGVLRCRAEELGGRNGEQPLPVSHVIVTRYRKGARWQPRPLSPSQAVLALIENAVGVRAQPEAVLEALSCAVRNAQPLSGSRGEADELAEWLLR